MPSGDEVKSGLKEAKQRFPLKRSSTDRIFLGVCGGLGRRMGIDANLVRLVWAAFSVGSLGMGGLALRTLGPLAARRNSLGSCSVWPKGSRGHRCRQHREQPRLGREPASRLVDRMTHRRWGTCPTFDCFQRRLRI
ncbi:MAG: PspC domain-containing protein [Caldilineaceae bacterium]|nr:PspC domain-containing protein [Caldilineaceae bacterium]